MKFLSQEELDQLLPAEEASFPSPVPTQIVSSDEYFPQPQTREQATRSTTHSPATASRRSNPITSAPAPRAAIYVTAMLGSRLA